MDLFITLNKISKDGNRNIEVIGILCKLCIITESNIGAYKHCNNLDWGLNQDYSVIVLKIQGSCKQQRYAFQ